MAVSISPTERVHLSNWVEDLAPWRLWFTGTFEGEFTEASAQRAFERFMRKHLPAVSYFYAIERNPSRAGHHVHALLAECEALQRSHVWKAWKDRFGRNRLEPVDNRRKVSDYCTKHLCGYLTKDAGWWNYRLASPELFHRNAG